VPWLLGWDRSAADPELRKAFAVSLHAGTGAAVLLVLRRELAELRWRDAGLIALSAAPAGLAGYVFERPIERHLGTPAGIAAGLLAGAAAMAAADRAPQRRTYEEATAADALWLGAAQAVALVPGVSRSGATLAGARARGFSRADAHRLARHTGLPVIGGATLLKALRLIRRGVDGTAATRLAAGAGAAFVSTLAAAGLISRIERDRPLWPFAAYRAALAAAVLGRRRTGTSGRWSTMGS
jgi:undecaprenyl-diphosphatase